MSESDKVTIVCKSEPDAIKLNMLVEMVDRGFVGQDDFKTWNRDGSRFSFSLRKPTKAK
jgi:hypothetical protein